MATSPPRDTMSPRRGVYRSFKQITKERLLEMLRTAKSGVKSSDWKVLIVDAITVKVMSSCCSMSEITEEGISLVEDLMKGREPLPSLDAVYFIQPTADNVKIMIGDITGNIPKYKKIYVFFSSPAPRHLVELIKGNVTALSKIAALREMNLEFIAVDIQGFTTEHDRSMEHLFEEHSDDSEAYEICIQSVAIRLSTVFASMKEFPFVRYHAAKPPAADFKSAARDLVPTKLAAALWDRLMRYKSSLSDFPQTETCELVIVDRSIDAVAPIIHEWTYDAMCHDLLEMNGNKFTHEITTPSGKKERRDVLLEDHDPVWLELRDLHIADDQASLRLTEKMQEFGSKNKAAQICLGTKYGQICSLEDVDLSYFAVNSGGQEISTRDMQKMIQALPQYREVIEKLGLHIHIATTLNEKIKKDCLNDIGKLEQDFVCGEASSKDLLSIIASMQGMAPENKLRLLLIYVATHPEKLDTAKRLQWMKLAKLSGDDLNGINNLEYLGISVSKKQAGPVSLKFRQKKIKKPPNRKEKSQDEMSWQLSRFYPLVEDIVEAVGKNELSKEEYPYVKLPPSLVPGDGAGSPTLKKARSVRTVRYHWPDEPSDSALMERLIAGPKIFIFIVGGMTRSELRTMHKLTLQLKRDVILGSTSLDTPQQFVHKLKSLSTLGEFD